VVGDKVLEVVAKRIKQVVRENDTVARLGGDEFVVLVKLEEPYRHSASVVTQKVENAISRQLAIEDQKLMISVSCGICVYPQDGTDADTLLRNTDTAMYQAKAVGRNNFQFYSEKMTAHMFECLLLESKLLKAISRDELELYFQPQVNLHSGGLLGVEALVRWRQPKLGLIMPDGFIPAAEETGLIIAIGDWVIQKACEQMSHWINTGVSVGRVAVNLSGAQCVDPNLRNKITSALDATNPRDFFLLNRCLDQVSNYSSPRSKDRGNTRMD
jgi:predicted signal transduction protein with EAL and GGDEF domain